MLPRLIVNKLLYSTVILVIFEFRTDVLQILYYILQYFDHKINANRKVSGMILVKRYAVIKTNTVGQ